MSAIPPFDRAAELVDQNFFMPDNPAPVREIPIPGYLGPIEKKLNVPWVKRIVEEGFCTPKYFTDTILLDEGDPDKKIELDALTLGKFPNCWKRKCAAFPHMTNEGGLIRYRITWHQSISSTPQSP